MKTVYVAIALFAAVSSLPAQDTFSIVAVDTVTGEIGSAGASCVGAINGVGAFILSDVLEGIGAIHTQASWLESNQIAARQRMLAGDSPQQIINYMVANDAQGNPTIRQYGIVDLRRNGESAAYTGVNCTNYKNHATGPGYAVQGNILSGQVIIDTMRNTFLRTPGPLADRLMATLEAAKIIGADTRCAVRNTSSQSGFIKVVRIGDGGVPYLQKIIPTTSVGVDPIDLLRAQFNQWKDSLRTKVDPFLSQLTITPDTLIANGTSTATILITPKNNSDTLLSSGRTVLLHGTGSGTLGAVNNLGNGTYSATVTAPLTAGDDTITARVVTGSDTVKIYWKRVLQYVSPTSVGVDKLQMPTEIILLQNYPNPFNPTTIIEYGLPRDMNIRLIIYDVLGRTIQKLVNGQQQAGFHRVAVDMTGISAGIYFYRLEAEGVFRSRKLVVLQ
ncbi:MAG: DUF1028 domain-containing protein [Bacteroidetes bacterium]|nr:DUF1028 domain-containing protein [Bacteroidota bacterium]MCW5895501.1 DUF1028 domain-containing protein [Bacteroidota bacterium]